MNTMLKENIRQAFIALKANALRSFLTLFIISIGITALIGILTALDSISASLAGSLSSMGANTYSIVRKSETLRGVRGGRQTRLSDPITFDQAIGFKNQFDYPSRVSISFRGSSVSEVKFRDRSTNPNVMLFGVDEHYLTVAGYSLLHGRNFTENEIVEGQHLAIVGSEVFDLILKGEDDHGIGSVISVGNVKYRVIGVMEAKGTSAGMNSDRVLFIPLHNARRYFGSGTRNYNISVQVSDATSMEPSISYATGLFRLIRRLAPVHDNDFEMRRSDSLISLLEENTRYIRYATIFIGLITLLGAAIGLMNIMLVSVSERTREIGVRKSLGASSSHILHQFIVEAVVLCQLGGLVGVVTGIGIGNLVSLLTGGPFIIPWVWILLGLGLCFIVGLASGIYPALKASRLDPIESLRYE